MLFFCFFTKRCMRSQKWDRLAVPFLGPCSGSFFEVCCIKVAEAQRFGFNEALWLMPAGRATVLNSHFVWRLGFEVLYHCYWWQCCDGGVGLRPRSFFGFGAFLFSSFGAWVDTPLLAWGSAFLPTPLFCFVLFICHLTLYSPVFVEIWDYPDSFTPYLTFRTEPLSTIGHTRGKKPCWDFNNSII